MKKKYFNIYKIATFFITIALFSCVNKQKELVLKFIYLKVRTSVISDSLGPPHLSIEEYLEYVPNSKTKIAKGNSFANKAQFDLDSFFEYDADHTLKSLLDSSFGMNFYESSYTSKEEGHFSVFICESLKGRNTIIYNDSQLPPRLDSLNKYIKTKFYFKDLVKVSSFCIDDDVFSFEKQLFLKHPPPNVINEPDIQDIPNCP